MSKKIVIVSSGQPSANPRLVKEATALSSAGYLVTVIYCSLSPWADGYDKKLFEMTSDIDWVKVGYHPIKNKWNYNYARVRKKYWEYFYRIAGNRFDAAIRSLVMYSQELNKEINKYKAEIYIGHNLGALPAVANAAKNNNSKAIFDFEDFHRGEHNKNSDHWIKTLEIENKYVPFLHSATAASPLIALQYRSLYPFLPVTTINNCFPLSYASEKMNLLQNQPLKLFWFSQTIGKSRGLETVIKAMGLLKGKEIELTLLGNCSREMKQYFINYAEQENVDTNNIHFLLPVPENEITTIAAKFHIGLSAEVPATINRDICLTNKIFMYLLAGNAIVFSRTKAHSLFLSEQPEIGQSFSSENREELATILTGYCNDFNQLNKHRENSLHFGKLKYNWDIEKEVLLTKIDNIATEKIKIGFNEK